jgi:hypothetical protein
MFKFIDRLLRQLTCRHEWRESRSWPGTKVCDKCALRKGRPHLVI